MSAYKRKDTPYYVIAPTLPLIGQMPRRSTRTTNKRIADGMEGMLVWLVEHGWVDLVRDVVARSVDLWTVWEAFSVAGRQEALDALRRRRTDPALEVVARDWRARTRDARVLEGIDMLMRILPNVSPESADAPANAQPRSSWLLKPRYVRALLDAAERTPAPRTGRPPVRNTVRRTMYRAIAEIITNRYGRGQMRGVLDEVRYNTARDERWQMLSVSEAQQALACADDEFRPILGLALSTGIDRQPLLEMRVRDYDQALGLLHVPDRKTPARHRILGLRAAPVLENAEVWLQQLVAGREPDDPLVRINGKGAIKYRWDTIREQIHRPDVRWKDLRGCFATHFLAAGGSPRDLQDVLGHAAPNMTMRYLRRTPVGGGDRAQLREQARRFGRP